MDDHQIMAVTGHRSVDGVRAYKRISIDQEEDASKIIQLPNFSNLF